MNFDQYQEATEQTAYGRTTTDGDVDRDEALLFLTTALNGETGELSEKIKKSVREDDASYLSDAPAEIGDILWYLARLAAVLDTDLETIADDNVAKLLDRDERDRIFGEGDHR